ncbi:MAG TPA: stage II sporulation protein M [Candidatus Baltobacteraceae bacterium]|nr:stage II sporulation protein M [Candidatus Baltobacteraceae bacterium]
MQQREFVRKRGAAWERLEALLAQTGRGGLRGLPAAELFELGRLYRWTTSDLAYAQGHQFDPQLVHYLNRLTARAHAHVYGSTVESGRERIARFFTHTFPAEFRRSWPYIGLCIALTILWAAVAYAIVAHDPSNAYALLPESIVPAHITKSLHDSNFAFTPDASAMMSSLIITNNVRVAILTFAAGIVTLGAGTLYLVIFNAVMLGALGALFAHAGFGVDFWATVAPHGFIELTAIQVAGGAGLLMAAGVLLPGRLRRRDALAQNSRRAGVLIAGVAAMLCVAGTIEAFFSPLRFPADVRASVGIITAFALIAYFGFAGRGYKRGHE